MPVAPLIPIVIIALGLGLAARVFIVVLFAFVFITVNTRAGVRNVEPSLIEMATLWRQRGADLAENRATERDAGYFAGMRIGLGRLHHWNGNG
jgi:NitT/TauT family transport system permease protein